MSDRSDRREQRQAERHRKRVARRAAKEDFKRRDAPRRIRGAATACFVFGVLAVLGGVFGSIGTLECGGEAYTLIVARLAVVSGAVAWLAAVVLFTGGALLKVVADVFDQLRRPSVSGSAD